MRIKEWFRQLWLIVGWNFKLRRRRPILLCVELLWPLVMMLMAVILRQVTWPSDTSTCRFAARALPSAGLLPFLQSYICNAEDECLNETQADEPMYQDAAINRWVDRFNPLIQDANLSRVLRDLPHTMGLLKSFQNSLESSAADILTRNLTLREFLKGNNKLEEFVVDENQFMSKAMYNALIDSALNISKFLELGSSLSDGSIGTILCDPRQLQQYISVPQGAGISINQISQTLCHIDPAMYSYISDTLKPMIDFSKLMKMSANLTSLFGDYELSHALTDVSEMLSTFDKLQSFANMSTITGSLKKLGGSLPALWRVLSSAQSSDFDFDFVMSVVRDMQMLTVSDGPDDHGWNSLNDMVGQAKNMFNWVRYNWNMSPSDSTLTLSDLFSDSPEALGDYLAYSGSPWTKEQLITVLGSKIMQEKVQKISSIRSPDELKELLCSSDPYAVSIVEWTAQYKQFLCTEPMITMLVSKFSLKQFMKRVTELEESSTYRNLPWTSVSKNMSSMSHKLKDEMDNEQSVLSQTMRFARSVRLDPIFRSAQNVRQASADFLGPDNDFAMTDLDSFMIKISKAVWAALDSAVGQDIGWWKTAKDSVYKTSVMYDWMTFAMKMFPSERITFGGMFTTPVTMDEFVATTADYLPTVLEAQASAMPTEELEQRLAHQPNALQEQRVYCGQDGGPGISGLFKYSPEVDMYQLVQIQNALCRLDPDLLLRELRQAYDFDSFWSRYNNPPSYSPGNRNYDGIGNYTFYGVYLSGSQMNKAVKSTTDRWQPWFGKMDLSWGKILNMMENRQNMPASSSNAMPLSFSDALVRSIKNTNNNYRMSSILYDVSKSIDNDLDLFDELTSPATMLGQLGIYDSTYAPYFQATMLETLAEPPKVKQLIKEPDWKQAFCGPNYSKYFSSPELPPNLDWNLYRRHICSLNVTNINISSSAKSLFKPDLNTFQALQRAMNSDSYQAYPSQIDWADFSRTLKSIETKVSGLSTRTNKRKETSPSQNFPPKPSSTIGIIVGQSTNPQLMQRAMGKLNGQLRHSGLQYYGDLLALGIRTAGMTGTVASDAMPPGGIRLENPNMWIDDDALMNMAEQILIPIDMTLTQWNEQMKDTVDAGAQQITLKQLFPNADAWQELMRQGLPLVDDLLLAAKETVINPDKLLQAVSKQKGPVRCENVRIEDFVELPPGSTADTTRLMTWLCANLDVLAMQLQNIPAQQNNSIRYSPQKLDWTHLATEVSKSAGILEQMMEAPSPGGGIGSSNPNMPELFPDVPGFRQDRVQSALGQVVQSFQNAQMDSKMLTGTALNMLQKTFNEYLPTQSGDDTTGTMWRLMQIMTLYVTGYAKGMTDAAERMQYATNIGRPINIEDIYSSPELKSASQSLKTLPGVVEYFMTSMVINPMGLQKLSADLEMAPSTWDELCTNVTAFEHYFPKHPDVTMYPVQAQSVLCPRTDSNKLAIEQQRLYPEIYMALDATTRLMSGRDNKYPLTVNYTDVYDTMQRVDNLSNSMDHWLGRVQFSNDPIFDSREWNRMFGRLGDRLSKNTLTTDSMSDFSGLLITSVPIFDRQMANVGLGPTFAAAEYFSLKGKQKLEQIAAQRISLEQSLFNHPQLRNFIKWMDDYAVDMIETLIYTWAEKPEELEQLINDRAFSVDVLQKQLCSDGNPSAGLISPPQKYVDTEMMVRRLCSLDLDAVLLQAVDWVEPDMFGTPQQKLQNLQGQFNSHYIVESKKAAGAINDLFKTYSDVTRMNPQIGQGLKMDWANQQTWIDVADRFRQYVADGNRWYLPIQLAGPLYDSEINEIPKMSEAMTFLNTIARSMKIEVALYTGQIDSLLTPGKSTELVKLKPVMNNGIDVVRMMFNSQINLQDLIQRLRSSPDAFAEFCGMQDIRNYFKVDVRSKITPEEIQKVVCSIDIDRLSNELGSLQGQYMPGRQYRPVGTHNDATPPRFQTADLVETSREIGDLLRNSELQGDGQFRVLGGTFDEWFYLLDMSFTKQLSGVSLMQPFNADISNNGLDSGSTTTIGTMAGIALGAAAVDALPRDGPINADTIRRLMLIANDKLDILLKRPTLSIDDLLPSSPYTAQALRQLLPVTPQLFDAYLWTSAGAGGSTYKLNSLGQIQNKEQAEQMICARGASLSQYLTQPEFSEQDWRHLQSPICFIIQNIEQIQREMESEWQQYSMNSPNAQERPQNIYSVLNEIISKISKISSMNIELTGMEDSAWQYGNTWETVIGGFLRRQNQMQDSGQQLMNQLAQLDNSNLGMIPVVAETSNQLNNMLNAVNDQLQRLWANGTLGYRPSLTVQDLVPTTYPLLQDWLQDTIKLSPQLADMFIRSKVKDLNRFQAVVTNPARYDQDICRSGRGMTDLLQFPQEVNPQEINSYFCGTNWNRVASELQNYFDIDFEAIARAAQMQPASNASQVAPTGFKTAGELANQISQNLQKLVSTDPSFVLPQGTEQQWQNVLNRIQNEMTLDDVTNLPQFFATITPILDRSYPEFKRSPLWTTAYPFYSASESLMDYVNGFWSQDQMLSDGYVNISALLDDRERLKTRLINEVGFSSTGADMLLKVMDSSPAVIIKISAMDSNTFARTVCDPEMVKKLFNVQQTAFFLSQQMCSKNPLLLKDIITRQYDIKTLVHQIENPWMQMDSFSFSQYMKVQQRFMQHIQEFLTSSGVVWDNSAWERYLGTVANAGSHLADMANQMKQTEKNRLGPLMDGVADQLYNTETGIIFQSAVKNLGLVFNAAKSGATSLDSFYVDLNSVLRPGYSFSQFLTRTFDQVPLFVEAFSNTEINAIMLLSRSRNLAWGDFCRDETIGPLFRFAPSIDTQMLARSLCHTNYQSIESEMTKQIDLTRVENQLLNKIGSLKTSEMVNSVSQLVRSTLTGVADKPSKEMEFFKDQAMVDIDGAILMRDLNQVTNTKLWPDLRKRMTWVLDSLGVVLYNSSSYAALQNYANTVHTVAESLRQSLESRDHDAATSLKESIKDVVGIRIYLENELGIQANVIDLLLNSQLYANKIWNLHSLCSSASLYADAFVSLSMANKRELEALLCQLHYPALLQRLQRAVDLKGNGQKLDISTNTADVDLSHLLDDLEYLARHTNEIERLWPEQNILQLLTVHADLMQFIEDYNLDVTSGSQKEILERNLVGFLPKSRLKDQPIDSSEVMAHVQSMGSLLQTVEKALKSQSKTIGKLGDLLLYPMVVTQELSKYGFDSDLTNALMTADISLKSLASLATPHGRRQFCQQGPKQFIELDGTHSNETYRQIGNLLCQKDNLKNFAEVLFENIDVDKLREQQVTRAFDVTYLLDNTEELVQLVESLANGADPTTLQQLIDTSKIYQVVDKHINGLGSISGTARDLLDNGRSLDYMAVAMTRAIAPFTAVGLDMEAIVSRDELIDELIDRLLNASQQMAGARIAQDIAYKAENYPQYTPLLFDSVCNYSTLHAILQEEIDVVLVLQSNAMPLQQFSNNLCNAPVEQWFAMAAEALGTDDNARIALKLIHAHFIGQVDHVDASLDIASKTAPVDLLVLTKHLNSLRQTLALLQGENSWQGSVRRFLDAIADMPEERGGQVAKKLSQVIELFNSDDSTDSPELLETGSNSNSIYRRLKDEAYRAAQLVLTNGDRPAGDFRGKPLSDDAAWQNSVKSLASTFGTVLDGQFDSNYVTDGANALWKMFKGTQDARVQDLMHACQSLPVGSYGRNKVDQISDYSRVVSEHLRKFPVYKNTVCDLPKMDVKRLYETTMYELGWAQTGEKLQNIGRSRRDMPMASCEQYMDSAMQLWSAFYNVMVEMKGDGGRQLAFCITQADTNAFKSIDRYLELASGVSSIVSQPGLAGDMTSLRPAFNDFAGMIDTYMPVYAPLKQYLINSEQLDYDLSVLEVPGSTRAALLNAEIDVHFVSTVDNADGFEAALCTSSKTKRLLRLPSAVVWTDWSDFTALLCANKAQQISKMIYDGLDMKRIQKEIPTLKDAQMRSPSWFLEVSQNGARMAEGMSKLSETGGKLLRDFTTGNMDMGEALYQMQYGYDFNDMKRLAQELVSNAGKLLGASPIVDDLQTVLDGIGGLDVLQKLSAQLLQDPYSADELFLSSNETRDFLLHEVGLTVPEVERLMTSNINLKGALKALDSNLDHPCSPEQLQTILDSPEDQALVVELSHKLCNVDRQMLTNFTKRLFTNIDPTLIIGRFIRGSVERKLEKTGMSPLEAHDTVDRMKRLPSLLPLLQDGLQDEMDYVAHLKMEHKMVFDSVPNMEDQTMDGQNENPAAFVGQMFCGKRIKNTLQKLKIAKWINPTDDAGQEYQITERDHIEMKAMKSDFCRDVYLKIVSIGDIGSIFWTYFRPVLLGEIAVVPNTVEARQISKIANKTFDDLADWFRMVKFGSHLVSEMTDLKKDPKKFGDLQSLLRHPLVRTSFQDALNVDSLELAQALEQGRNVDESQKVKLEQLSNTLQNLSQCINMDRFRFYRNEQDLNTDLEKKIKKRELLAAVIFTNLGSGRYQRGIPSSALNQHGNIKLPKHIKYRIRMPASLVPSTVSMREHLWGKSGANIFSSSSGYLYGFVQLQDMIDHAIIKLQSKPGLEGLEGLDEIGIHARQSPYPCHQNDIFVGHIKHWLPLIMIAAWLITFGCLINHGVAETDHKLAQVLRVCGLQRSVQWVGWFIVSTLFSTLVCLAVALLLKFTSILGVTNWFIVCLYLMTFCFAMSMMSFLICCFFTKPQLASLNGVIIYLMACLPYLVPSQLEREFGAPLKILLSLSAPSAFLFGTQYMTSWEATGVGLQWSNMRQLIHPGDSFSFTASFAMLIIDAVVYGAVAVLITYKKMNKNNCVNKMCNFCLKCSCKKSTDTDMKDWIENDSTNLDFDMIDNDMDSDDAGVKVQSLTKIYARNRGGVKNLRFSLKQGQITTLLGQNGAGKTTTIKLLTGIEVADQGSVHIFGKNVQENQFAEGPKVIGLCPQDNALYERLTVREHLWYFGKLKGTLGSEELKVDIERLLNDTKLRQFKNVQVQHLSGGMKRRLCVALAFVANSRLVILDEPTAGVDPVARRAIWDIVIKNKEQRTVLFCTHYLDEAEIISDKLAIMQAGKIVGMGTSEQLKEKFGCGYKLIIEKNSDSDPLFATTHQNPPADIKLLLKFVQKFIVNAELLDNFGATVTIGLPPGNSGNSVSNSTKMSDLVTALQNHRTQFGIKSFGISGATLEEVFVAACKPADKKAHWNKIDWPLHRNNGSSQQDLTSGNIQEQAAGESDCESSMVKSNGKVVFSLSDDNTPRHDGYQLKLSQFAGIMFKRLHHCRRDWKLQFSGLVLPCIFVLMAMCFSQLRPESQASPSLALSPEWYIDNGQSAFLANLNPTNRRLMQLSRAFVSDGLGKGLGTACFLDADPHLRQGGQGSLRQCTDDAAGFSTDYVSQKDRKFYTGFPKDCQCQYGKQVCPIGAEGFVAPRMKTNTSGLLYDLTDATQHMPLSTYLINTFQKNHELRFGGWSLSQGEDGSEPQLRSDIWFESAGIHALPAFLNGLSNMRLRTALQQADPEDDAADYAITTYNNPFDLQPDDLSQETLKQKLADVGIGLVLLCAFSFIPAALVIYVVQERVNKERHIQSLSGVGPLLYWSSSYLWDMLFYIVTLLLASIIIAIFKIPSFTAHSNLPATMLLITLYGLASLPLMYFLQRFFDDGMAAYLILFGGSVFIGMNTLACNMSLDLFSYAFNFEFAHKVTSMVFLIFPQYCFAGGLIELTKNQIINEIYESIGRDVSQQSPLSTNVIGYNCLCLALQSVLFFILTVLSDYCTIPSLCSTASRTKSAGGSIAREDSDVIAERSVVHNADKGNAANSNVLRVVDLHKVYKSAMNGNLVAVDKLCLAIRKGECFGLLGLNGAGKTSTFRMLTGDLNPTNGNAYLAGSRLTGSRYKSQQYLGYCPQEDACDQLLTTREQLDFYARLKGYHKCAVQSVTNYWLRRFSLEKYADQKIQSLSGGTRRKICVASALVGRPRLVLLDEPTAGMDIGTRRLVWREVQSILNQGRSVLLTSHSMQECDAVCSRLAIMVNGSLQCLGTPHSLKHKFGDGYTLRVKATSCESLQAVESSLRRSVHDCQLREKHYCTAEYIIPAQSIGTIFGEMEALKRRHNLLHYSITQTSLDQVFVSFAKLQTDGTAQNQQNVDYSNPALVDDCPQNVV